MEVNRSLEEPEPGRHPRIVQMSVQHAPTKTGKRSQALDTRVPGRWLVLARGIWITLVVLTLTIFFASLPVYIAQLQTPCAGSTCGFQQLTPEQVGALTGMGLSLSVYVAFTVALALASVVVCLVVSTLIVWRRSDDRMALLVALTLVTFGPIFATRSVSASPSPWQVPNECLTFLALGLLVLVFLLFPSGQFVPHWMRWTSVVLLTGLVSVVFVAPLKPNTLVELLTYLMAIGELATVVLVQLYRYRRVSSPLERQQTKWVVFGIAVPVTVEVLVTVPYLIFPEPGSLYPLASATVQTCLPLFLPLSFGFAMLRSRLWDIDVLINRTLVYGTLTAIVVGVYVLVVGILSTLLHTFGNSLIALLATGLVAVLFQPLRTRLQRMINRLMYGERDDPYAVLSYLGSRLEATLAPEAILPTIVETAAQALKQERQNQDLLAHGVIPADVPRLPSWGHLAQPPPSGYRSATAALFLPGGSQRRSPGSAQAHPVPPHRCANRLCPGWGGPPCYQGDACLPRQYASTARPILRRLPPSAHQRDASACG